MSDASPITVLCNGAKSPGRDLDSALAGATLHLNYLQGIGDQPLVHIGLPNFVRDVYHLPDRVLDLLEIAAYVYCADRLVRRGAKQAVEYQAWARSFHFFIRVRDYQFWRQTVVVDSLAAALQFMTGDREYRFTFQPGHATPQTSMFDAEQFDMDPSDGLAVILFSGGLDSLAGTMQRLEDSTGRVCLVSHQAQPGTKRTQNRLFDALKRYYPGRLSHYRFSCHLRRIRASKETQRTRTFLYTSIAYAIAQTFGQHRFFIYENGITGINFARREDLSNARATRTTHPQTVYRLKEFFSLLHNRPFGIELPFLWKTKTDIVGYLRHGPHPELVTSSVSCSRTFLNMGQATHCGGCSQCIDRRIAAYAAKADDLDEAGIYEADIVAKSMSSRETKTTAVDYLRQARDFGTWNVDHFYQQLLSELSELVDYLPEHPNETEAVERIWTLCRRHGHQVALGMHRMRDVNEDLFQTLEKDSLLHLISVREYLRNPIERLVVSVQSIVSDAIPKMFSSLRPADERDLNLKISALLDTHKLELRGEHPAVSFAGGHTVPDHGNEEHDLMIEAKYIRQGTPPSRASEGMAADLTKYPQNAHVLFLVYDPTHAIKDDQVFRTDFESKGRCTVCILR